MQDVTWQVAQVLESGADRVRVRFARPETCQRCQQGRGCGAGLFARLFARSTTELEVMTRLSPGVGDWVRVGVSAPALALSALFTYGLPTVAFVLGALPAHWWIEYPLWRDVLAFVGGLACALVVWYTGRRFSLRNLNPIIEPLSCSSVVTKSHYNLNHD